MDIPKNIPKPSIRRIEELYFLDPEVVSIEGDIEKLERQLKRLKERKRKLFLHYIHLWEQGKLPEGPELSPKDPYMTNPGVVSDR